MEETILRKWMMTAWVLLGALSAVLLAMEPAGAVFDDYNPSPRMRAMGGGAVAYWTAQGILDNIVSNVSGPSMYLNCMKIS